MTVNVPQNLDPSLRPKLLCFWYNYTSEMNEQINNGCKDASINQETGVQTSGIGVRTRSWRGVSFYLPYEMGFEELHG